MSPNDFGSTLDYLVSFFIDFASDFIAFIIIAGVVVVFGFYFGRDRIVTLIAGLYAAIPLYISFPYTDLITSPLMSVGLYLFFVIVGLIAFSGLSAFIASSSFGLIKLPLLSAIIAGMVIAVSIHILPIEEIYTFSVPTKALFASTEAFFLWLLAPLVALYFLGR